METALALDATDDAGDWERKVETVVILSIMIGHGVYTGISKLGHRCIGETYTPACEMWRSCGENAISKKASRPGDPDG